MKLKSSLVHVIVQGGGPYGMEVTRGQDLTGRDFSGRTLIKFDFKTVLLLSCIFN
jgi:hypothetical protein